MRMPLLGARRSNPVSRCPRDLTGVSGHPFPTLLPEGEEQRGPPSVDTVIAIGGKECREKLQIASTAKSRGRWIPLELGAAGEMLQRAAQVIAGGRGVQATDYWSH